MPDDATLAMFNTISMIIFVAAFVLAVGLFFILLLKRKPSKNVTLFPLTARQDLSDSEAEYFSFIKYNPEINSIVLKQSQVFKKCVVTLILKTKNGTSMKRYNLTYNQGDVFCGIKIDNDVEEYRVVLESVDKAVKKHAAIDGQLTKVILYALIVTVVFIAGALFYAYMCSFYIILPSDMDSWPGYVACYALALVALIYTILVIVGYLLFDNLSKKGAF